MENLYNYFIHYNSHTEYWNGVPRDKAINYLNGSLLEEDIIKSKNINDLIKYICKLK